MIHGFKKTNSRTKLDESTKKLTKYLLARHITAQVKENGRQAALYVVITAQNVKKLCCNNLSYHITVTETANNYYCFLIEKGLQKELTGSDEIR